MFQKMKDQIQAVIKTRLGGYDYQVYGFACTPFGQEIPILVTEVPFVAFGNPKPVRPNAM